MGQRARGLAPRKGLRTGAAGEPVLAQWPRQLEIKWKRRQQIPGAGHVTRWTDIVFDFKLRSLARHVRFVALTRKVGGFGQDGNGALDSDLKLEDIVRVRCKP
eukprot:1297382-Rhodomonas_salina.1